MVALRKDVKVGLTIGAIAVSVIGVYAGLSALASDKPADTTAKLNLSPTDGAKPAVKTDSARATTVVERRRAETVTELPAGAANPPAVANGGATVAAGNAPTNRAAVGDPWAAAFNNGIVPPVVTVTPDPNKPAADRAADRADTIKSINGAPTNTAGTTADASGAMNPGNGSAVLTRAAGDAAPTSATPAGPEKTHTVEPGETFSGIASQHYGDARHFKLILDANPQVDPNKLKPGTVVKIPPLAQREPKSDTVDQPAAATAAAIDATKQYVVKPGDSLHKIANSLWDDSAMSAKLYETNKSLIGADPAKLKLGMVLALPTPPTQKPGT